MSPALASNMEVVPLDEDSGYVKIYYFTDVDVTLKLPAYAKLNTMIDEVQQKATSILMPEYPDALFAFFAFQDDSLDGKLFSDMTNAEMQNVLETISDQGAALIPSPAEDIVWDVEMLRVPEPAYDFYGEHLLAIKNDWLINIMLARPYNAETPLEDLQALQAELMEGVFDESFIFHRYQSMTLPDSDISVSVPDSLYIIFSYEADDFYKISIVCKEPGIQTNAIFVSAVKADAYQDQTLLTLSDAQLSEMMLFPTIEGRYDETTVDMIENFESEHPVIAYESDGMSKHLMALRDGWVLYTTYMDISENLDLAWAQTIQAQIMHQLLGGEQAIDDWIPGLSTAQEGSTLRVPLRTETMTVAIPDGFGVDIQQDNADSRSIYLYSRDGSLKFYQIKVIPLGAYRGNMTIADVPSETQDALIAELSEGAAEIGFTAVSTLVEDGPGGLPFLHTTTEKQLFEQYYGIIDSCLVLISITSEGGIITEAESATLLNLLQ